MTEALDALVAFAAAHRGWAYALAFAAAMAEALPVIGTLAPGSLIVVGLGALVPTDGLALWPLLAFATLGAVAGDGLSFALGRWFDERLLAMWPFRRHPELIARGEALCRAHGGKAVFAARFVQGPRAFVPLAAGMLGMPVHRFLAVNLASACVWAPTHVLAGALIGGSLALAGAVAGRLALLLVVVGATIGLLAWLAVVAARRIPARWALVQATLAQWAERGPGWPRRQLAALLDPARPEATALALAALVMLGASALFLAVLEDVVTGDPLVRADAAIYNLLQGLRTAWADRVFLVVTELGDSVVLGAVAAAVLAWLALRRAWRAAAYWLGGLIAGGAMATALKAILHRPRPIPLYEGWDAFAFPSGHATMNTVLWGLLALLVAREFAPRLRPWVLGAAAGWVAAIAFSRLYLGAHWLSDVLGGMALGAAWVAVLALAYLRHRPPTIAAGRMAALALLVFATVGAWHVARALPRDLARYAVRDGVMALSLEAWWTRAWETLPERRVDLGGADEEPIVLQWAGPLGPLEEALAAAGWARPPAWSLGSALAYIAAEAEATALPTLPKFDDGRTPALTLVRPSRLDGAFRLVLRLWPTRLSLLDAEGRALPLWRGSVVAERALRVPLIGLVTRTLPLVAEPRAVLAAGLAAERVAERRRTAAAGWDGRVLLVAPRGLQLPGSASGKNTCCPAMRNSAIARWPAGPVSQAMKARPSAALTWG